MRPEVVFEVSYEAGNEIGGIYTVLNSKSKAMIEEFGEDYILIGPYFEKNDGIEFKTKEPPSEIKQAFERLQEEGIKAYWATWIEDEDANLILLDVNEFRNKEIRVDYKVGNEKRLNLVKHELWENYGINSLFMKEDFNKNVIWAWATGRTIEELGKLDRFSGKKLAHFHEWQSGAGLLYLDLNTDIPTVFTTHATNLGRTMSSHNPYFIKKISELEKEKVDQLANQHKIEGKHGLEKVCAEVSDCFTTVSEIIAKEAESILGKKPDIITPNALEVKDLEMERVGEKKGENPSSYESYLTWRLFSRYERYRGEIKKLVEAMFWPYYSMNFEDLPFIYTSGRYELKNKGFDLFIEALGKLNKREGKQAIAFIFVPTHKRKARDEIEKNLLLVDKIEDTFDKLNFKKKKRLKVVNTIRRGEKPDFIGREDYSNIRKWFLRLERFDGVPLSCFEIPRGDNISYLLEENGLQNRKEDRIKVVYYPVYLRPGDGVLNLEYYDAINGCDMGVFPSRYEPWGYTPMEAAAFLNATVTTNYAGFGNHVLESSSHRQGIEVLNLKEGDEKAVKDLAEAMDRFINMKKKKRDNLRIKSRESVLDCNWKHGIKNYLEAYEKALNKS